MNFIIKCCILIKKMTSMMFTCWQIEMRVGVKALESGVVPRNLMMLVGRTSANQVSSDKAALLARRLVFPQPPERK